MKLPGGDRAIVDEPKLLGYILNPLHPEGKAHARLFEVLLGISLSNSERLRQALLEAARDGEVLAGRPTGFGTKYESRFEMTGPRGCYIVLAVWIILKDSDLPRLVTAYIE